MITLSDYQDEIASLAKDASEEAREHNRDLCEVIHETVDGHQWVIYSRFAPFVLALSKSSEAGAEYGDLSEIVRKHGVDGLMSYLACAAMIQDVEQAAGDLLHDDAENA
jgi:hypothetical protein